ncbi:hypothetical protein ACN27F_26200 [Solwaraspora sp. WMMB335]|uniref:hypothetical protein n=1 Tax=Solwaraspora sp. WMMB335 TaxID=3404118 RepID=UPI003B93AC52
MLSALDTNPATEIAARCAHLLIPVKANRPTCTPSSRRYTSIGLHRTSGEANIARAARRAARCSHDLITAVTSNNTKTP